MSTVNPFAPVSAPPSAPPAAPAAPPAAPPPAAGPPPAAPPPPAAAPAAVVFFQSDGTAACTLSGTIPVGVTGVLATRATAALSETGTCLSPPEITQGSVQAFADQSAAGVICSAQVVDATNAAPAFVLALRTEAR